MRVFVLLLALASAGACARSAGPPYARAFDADGAAPRIVVTARQGTVPVVLWNTGSEPWNPATVHLSYHWLWFIPRELRHRSRWDVPYQEGIRTDLPAAVPPGGTVHVEARLLAPSIPGLYWLQWDMVEEGVTWFSETSPRQPRHLVVVLPSAIGALALLPLAVALAGLLAGDAFATFVGLADVAWCAATLFSKQLLLVPETVLEPMAAAYWLAAVAAVLPPVVLMLVAPAKTRPWILYGLGVLASCAIAADIIYYRFFGDVLSAAAILAAHQTGRVAGSIRSLVTPGLLWLFADLPFALWLVIRLRKAPFRVTTRQIRIVAATAVASLAVLGVALSAPKAIAASQLDQAFRNRALVEQLGPFGYHAYDAWSFVRALMLRPGVTADQADEARAWLEARAPLRSGIGPMFGLARGRNLIVIQVESLQDFVIDYRVENQEVMPHLRGWSSDTVRFTRVTDQTSEGRTSDAEFATLVSLVPLDHGAVAFRYSGNHYVGLPSILADHGYTTLSAVAFEPGFWNRRVMHPSYGFARSLFESDFTMTEQIGWGLNDRDFLQQMIPRLRALRQPFCAWLITLSLHHPFENFPDAHKVLKLGNLEGTSFGNYLHTMHFLDAALDRFSRALDDAGLLDHSMLVVFGDHDAGFARTASLAAAIGIANDEASWALNDRIPLLIRVHGAGGRLPGRIDRPAGQTDFAPTVLALLGVDPSPLPYIGRNLLGQPDDPPVLRPYGDWLDDRHLFTSHTGGRSACFDIATRAIVDPSACRDTDARAREARDVSRLVIVGDLQQQFR